MEHNVDPEMRREAEVLDRRLRDDPDLTPARLRAARDYPFPIAFFLFDEAVPDLRVICEADWPAAMAPLSETARIRSTHPLAADREVSLRAIACIYDTPDRERGARPAAVTPHLPGGRPQRPSDRLRQLNFRLDDEDYERVEEAAAQVGVRPTVFARLMTLRGTDELLRGSRS